ncbi:MAG: MgtC/SapB family protein [Opitutaceae bacterium]
MGLTLSLHWTDITLRLALTVIVGLVIGYNRTDQGKAAGMRTTLLVCLAASVAMIQVNLLLPTAGRPANSFVMNDLMRLPLGILTGVGFIGGGAILRRDNIVVGVTTAATLWLVTVIGLCIGGGQIALGLAATAIGVLALWCLKAVEDRLRHTFRAQFSIELDADGPKEPEIRHKLESAGLKIAGTRLIRQPAANRRELVFDVREFREAANPQPPAVLDELANLPGVTRLQWDGLR